MTGLAEKAMEEIPYITGYAAVKFNGELLSIAGEETEKNLKNIQSIVENYISIYHSLGEYAVGIPKEILMTTSEITILIRIFYNYEFFQLAVLKKDANLGYTRYMLHHYSKAIAEEV
ncbi:MULTISPECIES: hypothetical protein [unclassified Desulfurobacterium]|uniref:hypothetical protein n=1 Tax=unclassified Desulfurobacterium TaxID=2639089 RepID=UPI0003B605D2|nr:MULTISPECIES: hypothetical protein [unclassified Desulfurobacterium]